jgi:2-C-methyl-D-erythritol 4-phosphate cytidylyltransferase/2-C-methyl-D-erythritol 2,4-cyclodiphosphate synthase
MKVSAIILAAGAGKRIKSEMPKQYLLLYKVPIFIRTLYVFQRIGLINEIILIVPQKDLTCIQKSLQSSYGFTKIKHLIAGGKERQDSVRNGLDAIDKKCDIVVIHDAVRPFVKEKMITDVVYAASKTGAASLGVRPKDTIKETTKGDIVVTTIPRKNLWLVQTPQAFKYETLKKAYKKAFADNYYSTDDASLVEHIGVKVKMLEGSYENIKITTPEDLLIAQALLKGGAISGQHYRAGIGYDSHRLIVGRKLILGGVEIPCEKGLEGHSDADVLIHAVCDALLGACGLPDIGKQFPDTDAKYKNISSVKLLEKVKRKLLNAKFIISSIDATVILERPKIALYSPHMVSNIARALDIPVKYVSIKAKTNEGMSFIGKEEGIVALAIATVIENEK